MHARCFLRVMQLDRRDYSLLIYNSCIHIYISSRKLRRAMLIVCKSYIITSAEMHIPLVVSRWGLGPHRIRNESIEHLCRVAICKTDSILDRQDCADVVANWRLGSSPDAKHSSEITTNNTLFMFRVPFAWDALKIILRCLIIFSRINVVRSDKT